MRIVAVVQARMASTRLPEKVLLPLEGKPLLARMLERVQAASTLDDVVVATTTAESDDPIRDLCASLGVPCFSGHATDLLDRHYRAGILYKADAVAKIPSDCPLIDPAIVDRVVGAFRAGERIDYAGNLHPATWPDGNDVEVMPMAALEIAWSEAMLRFEREHTTPFFWERPELFRILNVKWESGRDLSMTHRFTIDYAEDYEFIAAVYRELHPANPQFGLHEILALLDARPDIRRLNAHLAGVNWYRHHLRELRTVSAAETREAP